MKNIFKLLRNSIKYRQHLFPSFRTTRYNHTFFQQIYQSTYNNTTKQIILTSRNVSSLIPYYISKDRSHDTVHKRELYNPIICQSTFIH